MEAVMRISLSRRVVSDAMMWLHSKNGFYSVKSSYHIARLVSKEVDGMMESSRLKRKGLTWPKLWKQGTESVLHVLWECGVAQDVWAGSKVCLQKCTTGRGDILQLIEDLMGRLIVDDMELFFVQCWVIWNQRNLVLHGGSIQDPSWLVRRAENYLKEYRDAQVHLSVWVINGSVQQLIMWKPPSGSIYKINVDATVFSELNVSGFGVMVHIDKGEVMVALSGRGPSVQDSEEVEVLARRRAVEFAMEAGFMEIILEGDNATVMKAIMALSTNSSRLGFVYEDIYCIGRGLRDFSVSYVRRTANSVAHSLARFAKHLTSERIWLEESPPPALEAMYIDSCIIMNE
ncbi:uncharacterized protein LOC142612059 [Castanea sativa]|uniref:uncharacterized protein LOC142612059 n=1 Tax=Castanea sativa TaxID=21020 RepID=UPI003F64B7E5